MAETPTVTALSPTDLSELQSSTASIRNVCVLAHVDHGKTTLSDHLIASNGLIHPRLAGELRYMDGLEDEQVRGITMKSSSISLLHRVKVGVDDNGDGDGGGGEGEGAAGTGTKSEYRQYLYNLIDSPGHVDFCSEVSAAVRLSDGGFVLVDAVEGVCIQTHAVLRQAWEEGLGMCLVVNKVDRLILETGLGCGEAYSRVMGIVQHVNMVVSSFESERWLSEADAFMEWSDTMREAREKVGGEGEEDYFSPVKGNVAFGSAYDGWAFTIQQFAEMYAGKLGCKAGPLCKALWGDYAYSAKTKRIVAIKRGDGTGSSLSKGNSSSSSQPLFVSWILEPIWKAYGCLDGGHQSVLAGLCDKLKLGEAVRKAVHHADARVALRALMRGWLPLSDAVLGMGVRFLPDPRAAAGVRVGRFLPALVGGDKGRNPKSERKDDEVDEGDEDERILGAITSCDASASAPLVIYVSKMVSVPTTSLPRSSLAQQSAQNPSLSLSYDSKDETFLAFGRVFAGQIRRGQTVHVIHADGSSVTATIPEVYLMMGRGLESLEFVPAGNVLAMRGLETAILKSATLSSSASCRPFLPLQFQAAPIVQVAVEPARPSDMDALERGLHLLHRADALVSVSLQESGEHVVSAAGEIHLETCIKDLRERFARVDLIVSPPLVRFKESLIGKASAAGVGVGSGGTADDAGASSTTKVIETQTPGKGCRMRVKVTPLADKIASEIEGLEDVDLKLKSTFDELRACFEEGMGAGEAGRIWQLGPKRHGPNMLLASLGRVWDNGAECADAGREGDGVADPARTTADASDHTDNARITEVMIPLGSPELSSLVGIRDPTGAGSPSFDDDPAAITSAILAAHDLEPTPSLVEATISAIRSTVSGISTGFQMATASGPLCGEPLRGVLVSIDARLRFATTADADAVVDASNSTPTPTPTTTTILTNEDVFGPFTGQVTATTRQAIHKAILENGPRIVEAYFLCEISTSSDGLSAVYAVLGRRRARILREELKEGSGLFVVMAHLPVEASFGFADELRRKSSGSAAASLLFSHWERLDVDPFFQPLTEEEREEFGEEGQGVGKANLAKKLIDDVLRRKGKYEQKLIADPTKQRTRARKV